VDLHRLPATDMSHCDVSAILAELQFLRAEVRAMSQLKDEMAALQHEVLQLKQCHRNDEVSCMHGDSKYGPGLLWTSQATGHLRPVAT